MSLSTFRRIATGSALLLAAVAGAGPAEAGSPLTAPIEQFNAGLLQAMKAGKSMSFQERYAMLAPIISRSFDLPYLVQSAAGEHWDALSPEQRQAVIDAFRGYATAICAKYFDDYSGERFDIVRETKTSSGDPVVEVKISPGSPSDDAHVLSFVMRQAGAEWKAVDVMMDGMFSLVAVKRSEIRTLLASNGEAGLIASLRQSIARLSDAASR